MYYYRFHMDYRIIISIYIRTKTEVYTHIAHRSAYF